MSKKVFEKLKERIKKDTGVELTNFRRAYVGKHQKGLGAFVWIADDGNSLVGSCETATNLIKSKKQLEILPGGIGLTEIL